MEIRKKHGIVQKFEHGQNFMEDLKLMIHEWARINDRTSNIQK